MIAREWRDQAACRGTGDVMFPDSGNPRAVKRAMNLCAGCPVQAECLTSILTAEGSRTRQHRAGIAAGTTPHRRAWLYERSVQKRLTVAQVVEQELTHRFAPSTIRDLYERHTIVVDGGHRLWLAKKSVYHRGRQYTGGQLAIIVGRDRQPVGRVRMACGVKGCVQLGHVADEVDRAKREAAV